MSATPGLIRPYPQGPVLVSVAPVDTSHCGPESLRLHLSPARFASQRLCLLSVVPLQRLGLQPLILKLFRAPEEALSYLEKF